MSFIRCCLFGRDTTPLRHGAALLLLLVATARAEQPGVTEANIEDAIQRAVTWIKAQRSQADHWDERDPPDQFWGGNTALALLALLYAGEDPRTTFMDSSLSWLSGQSLQGTYAYGTRAHVLALISGEKYRNRLEADLKWLVDNVWPRDSESPGAYGYRGYRKGEEWDNSNGQYGVLGVWMATDAGLAAPPNYWELVGRHWMSEQGVDGGWGYRQHDRSTGSMTAAGLATLFVVLDRTYGGHSKESAAITAAIDQGLAWLGREYTPENPFGDAQWVYYYLYGVERAARASGYKYFRDKDWFAQGAAFLFSKQQPAGQWRGTGEFMNDLRNTCFALMFLCHGRAPLLFNKLEHGPDWNSKLRDVSGLAQYAQRTLERLLNWQIVRLDSPLDDLLEAPVLYLRGHDAWEFDETNVKKIREYGLRGGLLLAVVGQNGEEFSRSVRTLAERAFPDLPLRALPADHPLFNGEIQFPIKKPPTMLEVHNGLRTLMFICEDDLADAWSRTKGRAEAFQLGCNIYNYATDKATVRSRLETTDIPLRPMAIKRTIKVALIKYNGAWQVEPYGWIRLQNYLNNETRTRLVLTPGLTLDSKPLENFRIAFITGLKAFELSPAEQEGLQGFLRGGGTLLADSAGGANEFCESLEACLTAALKVEPARLPANSPVITGVGLTDATNLTAVGYTRAARGHVGGSAPFLKAYDVGRRLAVIYSPLDISVGLLGTHVYDLRGHDGDGALRIMRNLLLYADLPARDKARLASD